MQHMETLEKLWSAMVIPEYQSNRFLCKAAQQIEPHQTVVEMYEKQTEKLRERKPVMALVTRREELKTKLESLQKKSTRPDRLFSADSRQLLVQEHEISQICSELLNLNVELMEAIPRYEKQFRERFAFEGRGYLQLVVAEHSELEAQLKPALAN